MPRPWVGNKFQMNSEGVDDCFPAGAGVVAAGVGGGAPGPAGAKLHVGHGPAHSARVVTASLDMTVKLYSMTTGDHLLHDQHNIS